MAVLLSSDWKYPRTEPEMDLSSSNSSRQRSSPANDHSSSPHVAPSHHLNLQQQVHVQQLQGSPYTYPLQQQPQGSWTPSIAAAPFYPSFFPNQQQPGQSYPNQIPPQAAYFDPANAQLAQWAYQQMMFSAQHGFPQMPPQRTASNNSASNDYFSPNQMSGPFNPFPSGTPPPHVQRSGGTDHLPQGQQHGQYTGFHPYRRPNRQGSHTQDGNSDWRSATGHGPQPPYARPDASGSSSSVNSSNSQRQRTNSNQSGHSGHNVPSTNSISRSRNNGSPNQSASSSTRSSPSTTSAPVPSKPNAPRVPHNRNGSSSSTSTAASSRPSVLSQSSPTTATSPTSSSTTSASTHRLARPSPLSQGNFTASEKRMSRDDSDLAAMLESSSKASSGMRSGGLKGRLRRALSFNALKEEDDDDESIKASAHNPARPNNEKSLTINSSVTRPEMAGGIRSPDSGLDDGESTVTVQTKKKGRAASLFNSRLNASTDNISLSSTVSSASVMIRKLGSMSKLVVRRNSLAGITSIFKDKNKESDKGKKKDKKGAKTAALAAEVSHVHAELDRISGDRSTGTDANGLSPAAELVRQHTLKTKAEAAAKAKAQQESQATAATSGMINGGPNAGVPTWDKNTATRAGPASLNKQSAAMRVSEDGTQVVAEEEDEESDDGHYDPQQVDQYNVDGWDDDDDWDVPETDEDVTIRVGKVSINDEEPDDVEPWAVDVRRSLERTQKPMKGILKNAGMYDQTQYLNDQPVPTRARSNSYNSHTGQAELGPLARIPSPDPDHIDGLHRHNSHSSGHGNSTAPLIPPLKFDSSSPISPTFTNVKDLSDTSSHFSHTSERPSSIFQHPSLNSSAPALSMVPSSAPTLTHRSATAPTKKLAFATSLSVYDTFSATVYDRRSEPATWSRLTPALAQRIKEELNSYKMEEMEVHAASRIHTQFFV